MTSVRSVPMDPKRFRIVQGLERGTDYLISLAALEGWDPGRDDALVLDEIDDSAVLIAEVDGTPVGGISVVGWNPEFCFVGYFLVAASWRGQGIGRRLWVEALRLIGSRSAGLDAVPKVEEFYANEGFVSADKILRFEGDMAGISPQPADRTRRVEAGDLARIVELDQARGACRRQRYLRVWLERDDAHAVVSLADDGMQINGLGVVRESLEGWRLGPIYGEDSSIARDVVRAVLHQIPESARADRSHLSVHVPEHNELATTLFSSFGFTLRGWTIRMHRGAMTTRFDAAVFGTVGPELG